jgi:hypothetical protein
MLSRSLLAATVITGGKPKANHFKQVLACSLPNAAWGEKVSAERLHAAHKLAWDSSALEGRELWVHEFHMEKRLSEKAKLLLRSCPDEDAGTMAVCQCLATEAKERAAAFAFALYPAALTGKLSVGAEGVNDLGKLAKELLRVDVEVSWQERLADKDTKHPEICRLAPILAKLEGARKERATQLFYWAVAKGIHLPDPEGLEAELEACVLALREVVQ